MRTARSAAIAAVLGGRMLVAGGVDENYERLRSVEALEPVASTSSFLTPLCANASLPSARRSSRSRARGARCRRCSRRAARLRRRCSMAHSTSAAATTASAAAASISSLDGRAPVAFSGNDRVGGCLRSVERLNEAGAWEAAPPMLCARRCAVAAALDGLLYVCGGRDEEPGRLRTPSWDRLLCDCLVRG